jgi:hypothetical protein
VVVDLPGLSSASFEKKDITQRTEYIEELSAHRKGKISRVIIEGNRRIGLLNYQRGSNKPGPIPYIPTLSAKPNNSNTAEEVPQNLKELHNLEPNHKRAASPFKITVNLPQEISDNLADAKISIMDGVYYLWLPKKATDQPANVVKTDSFVF